MNINMSVCHTVVWSYRCVIVWSYRLYLIDVSSCVFFWMVRCCVLFRLFMSFVFCRNVANVVIILLLLLSLLSLLSLLASLALLIL